MLRRHRLPVRQANPAGHYNADGVWVAGAPGYTHAEVLASVQPASPQDLQMLPEGRRQNRAYRLFCDKRLRGVGDAEGPQNVQPDQVRIGDDWYEVTAPEEWRNGVRSHHTTLVVRLEEQPE